MLPEQDKYRLLLENMPVAFAYQKVVTDSAGNPVDYIILDVNPAFEKMTGFSREMVLGKKAAWLLPEKEKTGLDWISSYRKMVLTGESISFEHYFEPLDRWYELTVFSVEPGYFATTFHEITAQKQEIVTLEILLKMTEKLLQLPAGLMDYQVPVEAMKMLSGAKYVAINIYEDKGTKTVTKAMAGTPRGIRRASEVLGFELLGKAWDIIPERLRNIKGGKLVRFNSLYETSMKALSEKTAAILQRIFGLGYIYVIELSYGVQETLGDFIFFMKRGSTINNREAIELYASQFGAVLARKQTEQKLVDYTLELEQLYHKLDEELDKARQVHERTLPTQAPEVEGLSFAAHYKPAQKLGGDLYDIVKVDNKLVVYFSDVTGHGLDGAMLSVFVKDTINSYISLVPSGLILPQALLVYLADQFTKRNYPDDYFISIFLAVLDLETMEMSYAGAGFHDSPLVQLGTGEQLKLISKGLPISSAFHHELLDFSENTITLTPGTSVLINTDGLTEQKAGNIFYGKRLQDVFYSNSHLSPEQIVLAINEDFQAFNNCSLQGEDDITFGILKVDTGEMQEHNIESNNTTEGKNL